MRLVSPCSLQTCDGAAEPRQAMTIELLPCEGQRVGVHHVFFEKRKNGVFCFIAAPLLSSVCISSRAPTSNSGWFPHRWPPSQEDQSFSAFNMTQHVSKVDWNWICERFFFFQKRCSTVDSITSIHCYMQANQLLHYQVVYDRQSNCNGCLCDRKSSYVSAKSVNQCKDRTGVTLVGRVWEPTVLLNCSCSDLFCSGGGLCPCGFYA